MFCENCGATMRDGSQFCSSCGTKVAVKVDYNYNRDLSEFHQRVWQDVLGLSATIDGIRQRNYRVDKGGGLAYRRTAAQAVGVSPASL